MQKDEQIRYLTTKYDELQKQFAEELLNGSHLWLLKDLNDILKTLASEIKHLHGLCSNKFR